MPTTSSCLIDNTGTKLFSMLDDREECVWDLATGKRKPISLVFSRPRPPAVSPTYDVIVPRQLESFAIVGRGKSSEMPKRGQFLFTKLDGPIGLIGANKEYVIFYNNPIWPTGYRPVNLKWHPGIVCATVDGSARHSEETISSLETRKTGLSGHFVWSTFDGNLNVYERKAVVRCPLPESLKEASPVVNSLDDRNNEIYFWTLDRNNTARVTKVRYNRGHELLTDFDACPGPGPYAENPIRLADGNILVPCADPSRLVNTSDKPSRRKTKRPGASRALRSYLLNTTTNEWSTLDGLAFYGSSTDGRFLAFRTAKSLTLTIAEVHPR